MCKRGGVVWVSAFFGGKGGVKRTQLHRTYAHTTYKGHVQGFEKKSKLCSYRSEKKSKLCSYRSVHMYGNVRAYD